MRRTIISGLLMLVAILSVGLSVLASETNSAPADIDPFLLRRSASAMAPHGIYWRNIGFVSTVSPVADSQSVEVDGHTYFYNQGIFWVQRGSRFIVVGSPVGAVVNTLPDGTEKLPGRKDSVYYWYGAFFGENEGKYEVIKPPIGAIVGYIPEGYKQMEASGAALFWYSNICFKPVMEQQVLMYQVDDCVAGINAIAVEQTATYPDYIKIIGSCDNTFTLSINGEQVIQSDDWTKPVSVSVELRDGDVVTAVASDNDGGSLCGFAVAGLEGGRQKFTSTDFYYTLNPKANWQTTVSLEGYRLADPNFTGLSHAAAKKLGDPRIKDVWSSEKAKTVYFKLIYGEAKPHAEQTESDRRQERSPAVAVEISTPTQKLSTGATDEKREGNKRNLALRSVATASSAVCKGKGVNCYSAEKIIDGIVGGFTCWMTDESAQWVELTWKDPIRTSRVELYTTEGYAISSYSVTYWTGSNWATLASVTGNKEAHRTHTFDEVTTTRLRLIGHRGAILQPKYLRVNELEVYGSDGSTISPSGSAVLNRPVDKTLGLSNKAPDRKMTTDREVRPISNGDRDSIKAEIKSEFNQEVPINTANKLISGSIPHGNGTLDIQTTPPDAEFSIFYGNTFVFSGIAPFRIYNLSVKTYNICIEKQGYDQFWKTIPVGSLTPPVNVTLRQVDPQQSIPSCVEMNTMSQAQEVHEVEGLAEKLKKDVERAKSQDERQAELDKRDREKNEVCKEYTERIRSAPQNSLMRERLMEEWKRSCR